MESINVVIDDDITKVAINDSGEWTISKETIIENEAQEVEVEERSPKRESTLVNSRMEIRSSFRSSSPLTPPEVHPPISQNDEVSTSKKPSSRVFKNHLESNIIGSLDEGLHLRKGSKFIANHVTYHCYLAQFEPKKGRRSSSRWELSGFNAWRTESIYEEWCMGTCSMAQRRSCH